MMKHICYFYILDFRSIHNLGISLDARYTYEWNTAGTVLSVRNNKNYIEGIWPTGIYSLSAIVGRNGTGKSTFLESMLTVLSGGKGEGLIDAVIVYEDGRGQINVYCPDKRYQFIVNGKPIESGKYASKVPNVIPFYYSTTFRPFSNVHTPGDGELGDAYNASDTWRLIQDLQDYTTNKAKDKNAALMDYFDAYKAQDNNRIVQLLCDKELRSYLPQEALPRYVMVYPNESGYKRVMGHMIDLYTGTDFDGLYSTKERYIARIVYNLFYNIESETNSKSGYIVGSIREKWTKIYTGTGDLLVMLEALKDEAHAYVDQIDDLKDVVKFLLQSCTYNENADTLYMDLESPNDEENIQRLIKLFQGSDFKVARYFDLRYSRDTYGRTRLSSGELDMLKLCSRLYDSAVLYKKRKPSQPAPQLLLIDEAENSYHPEWQRQFVNVLLQFVQALQKKAKNGKDFQIVLTTHSPILLSDIPRMCINYLERDDEGKVMLISKQPETFGANVFDLYRDSFFMSNGLVGEYAQQKIRKIQNDIKDGGMSAEDIEKEINLIGDRGIRAYLQAMLDENDKRDMLAYYKSKVKELENKNNAKD